MTRSSTQLTIDASTFKPVSAGVVSSTWAETDAAVTEEIGAVFIVAVVVEITGVDT